MNTIVCCLCGSERTRLLSQAHDYITGEPFNLVQCQSCGLSFVNPQPRVQDLSRYYPQAHQRSEPAAYERMDAKPRVKFVTALRNGKPARVLDIGCGKGLLLAGLQQQGWYGVGIEMSENSAAVAKQLGVKVLTKPLDECLIEPGTFDVICLYHSLEHMARPNRTLEQVRTLIAPEGHLVIEVPNYGSWYARAFGNAWFHLDVPRHLYHFTRHTLSAMLEGTGFAVERVETRHAQYDAFGAVQSTLNLFMRDKNLLNSFNTGEVTWLDIRSSPHPLWRGFMLLVSEASLLVGYPLFLGLGAIAAPFLEGGTLRIVARPR